MSEDVVDDLHYAEERWQSLHFLAQQLVEGWPNVPDDVGGKIALLRAEVLRPYCRPTCEADGDPDFCRADDVDDCGCPCGHGEQTGDEDGLVPGSTEWYDQPHKEPDAQSPAEPEPAEPSWVVTYPATAASTVWQTVVVADALPGARAAADAVWVEAHPGQGPAPSPLSLRLQSIPAAV